MIKLTKVGAFEQWGLLEDSSFVCTRQARDLFRYCGNSTQCERMELVKQRLAAIRSEENELREKASKIEENIKTARIDNDKVVLFVYTV